ncbi:YkgJ family cysteine cluster protein [Candidatus Woesearchaeota archaeon]|nr:YkgJ family cysteine cluster protein [Candidatus Woesearchaeota archaeon]
MIHKNTPLKNILELGEPCRCERCENACKFGSGFLVEEDLERIAKFLKISQDKLKEKYLESQEKFHTTLWKPKTNKKDNLPFGQCVFFNPKKGCSIHEVKPLECRVAMNCKDYGEELIIWFHLNYFLNPNDPESIRQYATYLKSGGKTLVGAQLEELVPDQKELGKILKYEKLGYEQDWEEILGIKGLIEELK